VTDAVLAGPAGPAGVLVASAVSYALKAAALLTSDDMSRATPCTEWDVAGLLRHLADSMAAFDEALGTGKLNMAVPAPRRPPASQAPVELLRDRAAELLCTLFTSDVRTIDVNGLPMPGTLALATGAMEISVHGWDIYAASGHGRVVPSAIARPLVRILPYLVPDRGELFASPVAAPPCASAGDRLVAYLGRDPGARRGGYSRVA
jgi:uncharacterized protein (TIGR03086 family)